MRPGGTYRLGNTMNRSASWVFRRRELICDTRPIYARARLDEFVLGLRYIDKGVAQVNYRTYGD